MRVLLRHPRIGMHGGHAGSMAAAARTAMLAKALGKSAAPLALAETQVIVTAADWPMRATFMAAVRAELQATQQRAPYYPGSSAKIEAFRQRFSGKEVRGTMHTGCTLSAGSTRQQPRVSACRACELR